MLTRLIPLLLLLGIASETPAQLRCTTGIPVGCFRHQASTETAVDPTAPTMWRQQDAPWLRAEAITADIGDRVPFGSTSRQQGAGCPSPKAWHQLQRCLVLKSASSESSRNGPESKDVCHRHPQRRPEHRELVFESESRSVHRWVVETRRGFICRTSLSGLGLLL